MELASTGTVASGVDVNCDGSFGDQSSVSSTRASQKKKKAVVRKESADTQECESCHQNGMEGSRDESMPTAGWRESFRVKYMCDKKCNKEGFKFNDIAAISVENDGKPHTINLCENCHSLRLA